MKLPDPISNPEAPGFSSSILSSVQPIIQDAMPNTKVLSTSSGQQYWQLTLAYADLLKTEYNILTQQIDSTISKGEALEVWLPQYEDYTFKLSSYAITASTVSSVTLSKTGMVSLPKIGNLIQFQNHKKVYRITGVQVNSTTLTISFYPSLRVTVPNSTIAKFTGIYFNMDFIDRSNPITEVQYNSDGYYGEGLTIELRESI